MTKGEESNGPDIFPWTMKADVITLLADHNVLKIGRRGKQGKVRTRAQHLVG